MKNRLILFLNIFILGLLITTANSCKEDELLLIKEVVMTWDDPSELVVGLPLTREQLNATANVPGTMVFTPALGTVLPLGESQVLTAEFTPRDKGTYKAMTKTVAINIVEKYIPVIIWENPPVLAEGEPLTEEQLNAEVEKAEGKDAVVEGTFVYDPPLGTILPLGENQELTVEFIPSVPTYQATSKTVLINVRDVVPLRVVANSAMYTSATTLEFEVSGDVGSLGASPLTGFTVHVKNVSKSIDKDFEITDISFDPANPTKIELTLAKEVYADDLITITYNEDGNTIVSSDEQIMKSFDAQTVAIPLAGDDLLAGNSWAGFEGTAVPDYAGAEGYYVGAALPWQRTTEKFVSGVASMKYTGGFDVKTLYGMAFGNNVDIQPGAFEVTHKIYIEPGSDLKVLRTAIARKSTGWGDDVVALWDVENIARGEWVTLKQVINIPVAINSSDKMRYSYYVEASNNAGVTGDQTFYLDDMGLTKVDVAPRP